MINQSLSWCILHFHSIIDLYQKKTCRSLHVMIDRETQLLRIMLMRQHFFWGLQDYIS